MAFMGITEKQRDKLEMEFVPQASRLKLTRLVRNACDCDEGAIRLVRTTRFVNMANHVMNRQVYELESDDWGEEYPHAAYAVIQSELELILQRPTTAELAEILGDCLQARMLRVKDVNEILKRDNCGFFFQATDDDDINVSIKILAVSEIPAADLTKEHPNIRALVSRMDHALNEDDAAGVLHASASIFETLAKDTLKNPAVESQPLGSFFGSYRNASKLPTAILDYIHQIYRNRNTEPLAGHGSTTPPGISKEQAVILAEMTKAIVRSERLLSLSKTTPSRT
jgi:hypothetical protein